MSEAIGIDLGTTSSRVAVIRNGLPIIIENMEGDGTTPSHVAITDKGQVLVGKSAKRYALKDPQNVVFSVKRFIGRRYDDPIVQQIKNLVPYKLVKAKNGDAWVRLQGKDYSPEQITAYTLLKMKRSAEAYLGQPVIKAVITVPAYFNQLQRKSTRDAAKIAGINVLRLYAEPTLAAEAYGMGRSVTEKIAVYDLGGGTFDISILEIGDGVFEVRSTAGDMFLGGEDFDFLLVKHIVSEYEKSNQINLMEDSVSVQRLKAAAETAKIILSTEHKVEIDLPFIAADDASAKHLRLTITRELFEDIIGGLIKRSIEVCRNAIKHSGFKVEDINQIILVGGSTRIPLVQRSLFNFFGKYPYGGVRREDSVALGAAIEAGILTGKVSDVLLLDVIPFSIGIETFGGVTTKILEANTTIPTKKSEIFSTATDNQSSVSIHIVQGENIKIADNETLCRFELTDIPLAPKATPKIEVTFDIDANGILHVSAKDLETNKEQEVRIEAKGGLSDEEIQKLSKNIQNPITINDASIVDNISTNGGENNLIIPEELYIKKPHTSKGIFISYAHEDLSWAQLIHKSLSLVASKNGYEIWLDRMINTGEYWENKIYSEIEKSSIAILVLSHDFLNSNFILNKELPRIFAEKERRYLKVFPIMVRSCPYTLHEDLAKFQFFNDPEKPFASLQQWEVDKELTRLSYELARDNKKDYL